ncbi:MAG: tRNA pseudouridine(55) synthase TruB [Micrococcales bacterium]
MKTAGLLLVDKPSDWTSHDVVAKVRGLAGTRRVGHAGTLDPMATGLLILGLNAATKLLTFLVGESKTYETTIRLGANTITDDREGEVLTLADPAVVGSITPQQIESVLATLRGDILQIPSSVSAIKVDGKRAYAKVRSGDEVKLAARPVTISRFELLGTPQLVENGQYLDIQAVIDCSSGTYIRALARDLGASLGVGGHLTALRRTRIGHYTISQAQPLANLKSGELPILSAADAAAQQFERRSLDEQEVIDIRHGKRISSRDSKSKEVLAGISQQGELVALLERSGNQLKSVVVFAQESND